jgi:hypothetical protein
MGWPPGNDGEGPNWSPLKAGYVPEGSIHPTRTRVTTGADRFSPTFRLDDLTAEYLKDNYLTGFYFTGVDKEELPPSFFEGKLADAIARLEKFTSIGVLERVTRAEKHDYHCFVAGTLVETEHGPLPIEQVRAGDSVWTRAGLRRVTWSGSTGVQPTHEAVLSNGDPLVGTGDHLVWTNEDGWVALCELTTSVTLFPWSARPSRIADGGTTAGLSRGTPPPGAISSECPMGTRSTSTESFGRRTTDRFREDSTSTTSTRTRATTTSPTSPSSSDLTTCDSTPALPSARQLLARVSSSMSSLLSWLGGFLLRDASIFEMLFSPLQPSGTPVQPVSLGTLSTQQNASGRGSLASVVSVGPTSSGRSPRQPTAAPSAGRSRTPSSSATCAPQAIRVISVRPTGRSERVFDLTVEGEHEFFANGVLVHNCNDYLNFAFVKLYRQPAREVMEVRAVYPTGQTIQVFPREWIRLYPESGQFHLVPTSGSLSQVMLGGGNGYLPFIFAGLSYLPQLWEVDYVSGFDPEAIPREVISVICKMASIDILTIVSDQIGPIGVASSSVGIDGMSQSISRQLPAFKARIDRYCVELGIPGPGLGVEPNASTGEIAQLRRTYYGLNMSSV